MSGSDQTAKEMYLMFSAMYKPIEKKMLDHAKKVKPDFVKKYQGYDYLKKICILDKYASDVLGL